MVVEPYSTPTLPHRDRQLNAAIHRIALTQARCHPDARALLARHKASGDDGMEAFRILKRRLSDVVFKAMAADLSLIATATAAYHWSKRQSRLLSMTRASTARPRAGRRAFGFRVPIVLVGDARQRLSVHRNTSVGVSWTAADAVLSTSRT